MVDENDIELGPTNPNAEKVKAYFLREPEAAPAPVAPDAVEDLGPLEYRELCEELLAEYKRVCERADALVKIRATLRGEILRLAGDERGIIQRGGYAVTLKERAGQVKFDWKGYVLDQMGLDAIKEIDELLRAAKSGKAVVKYVEQGEPSLVVEVQAIK